MEVAAASHSAQQAAIRRIRQRPSPQASFLDLAAALRHRKKAAAACLAARCRVKSCQAETCSCASRSPALPWCTVSEAGRSLGSWIIN